MERQRDIRRGNMAAANGLSRRRPRSSASTNSSFRESPEDDGGVELQDMAMARLRDRAVKRGRDRLNRNKRRRGERLILGGHREDAGDESSEDSIDDDDEDEDDESNHHHPIRMRPPNPASSSAHSNHHLHRKNFPPPPPATAKVVRSTIWKVSDEMSFSIPKKARSASTKRPHESYVSGGGGGGAVGGGSGEQAHRQASTSPARPASAHAPTSPSSSTASIRKKMKPIGAKPKQKPPKPAPVQNEIEIEVAEVLYGLLRQSQCPSEQEPATNSSSKFDSRDANGSGNDAKSRVSSPNSAPPLVSKLPQNSSSTITTVSAVAPKRKRPRPVKFDEENTSDSPNKKDPVDEKQLTKAEASSTKLDKNSGSNGSPTRIPFDFGSSQATNAQLDVQQELKAESNSIAESKPVAEESIVGVDNQTNDMVNSPKKEFSGSKSEFDHEKATVTQVDPASVLARKEENFKFDLMAPPSKSSPERNGEVMSASDAKPIASDTETKMKANELKEKENVDINGKKDAEGILLSEKDTKEASVDVYESQKPIAPKRTILDPQIDSNKDNNKDCGPINARQQQIHIQQQQLHQSKTTRNEPKLEIAGQSISSVPLPMNITGWPGGLTPMGNGMGQIRFQGMASIDGTPGPSNSIQPPNHLLTQPRPKRCVTHYYIARKIYYHQQFTKMNPFWPAAASAASLYGNKSYNLNVIPPTETAIIGNPLLGNFAGKGPSTMQDRGQVEGIKDKSSVATHFIDSSQGKILPQQLVLQQPSQQAVMQGPAFIFPPNQQHLAVSSSTKNGIAKGNAAPSPSVQSVAGGPGNSSAAAAGVAAMSFSYPNMSNEAQYVAILQNNGYPFPVPAPVGHPSSYNRGTAPSAMPFYSGPVYSSQVMHPSQLQQQQLQQQLMQSHSQQQPSQQGHQNTSTSSGSSTSQKHQQQNQQPHLQGNGINAANGTSNSLSVSKNRPQKQQSQPFPVANQVRHHELDMAAEDGTTVDANRISQAHKNTYGHNFTIPMHAKNFASLSSAALPGSGGNGYHSERQQQQQHQSNKGGADSIPNQTFAMPFTSFNGGTAISGLDFSTMAQNHVIFQSVPDVARQGYQIAAVTAQTPQQKKNNQIFEEGKMASDSNNVEDERKSTAGKDQPSGAQAVMFARTDPTDPSVSTILGNSVVESSARTLNLISSPSNGNRSSRPNTSAPAATATTGTVSYSQQQQQQQQQHLQQKQMGQLMQMQQFQQMQLVRQQQMHQQMAAAAAARGKPSTPSSSSAYTDSISSSSMAAKFSNTQYFPEALIQGGSSNQSPQWKNTRTSASSSSSPSLASTNTSIKNFSQQQGRGQQGHTQISFGVNSKQGNAQHGQQIATGNQSPSSPVVVGSPPTSVSKSAGGSPRASSSVNKLVSAPTLSSQQPKTSSSGPSRKSSPVHGRNAPSNLGNSHITPAPCSTTKSSQSHHQQTLQQQQQQKHTLHQAQLFYSMQAQSSQLNSTPGNTTGVPNNVYYQQRRQPPEHQQQQGSSNTSGMLSLGPLTLASTTSDPTKATAANTKGGIPPPGMIQAAQFATQPGGHSYMSTAFPYIHAVPTVQVKPAEQKQPAGNDNLHACQPEKK